MEKVSFGMIAETMDSEAVNALKQCRILLSESHDKNRRTLGESMDYIAKECESLERALKELESLEQVIMDLLDEARRKEKVKRR